MTTTNMTDEELLNEHFPQTPVFDLLKDIEDVAIANNVAPRNHKLGIPFTPEQELTLDTIITAHWEKELSLKAIVLYLEKNPGLFAGKTVAQVTKRIQIEKKKLNAIEHTKRNELMRARFAEEEKLAADAKIADDAAKLVAK